MDQVCRLKFNILYNIAYTHPKNSLACDVYINKDIKNNNKDHKQSPKDIRKRGQPTQKYLAS